MTIITRSEKGAPLTHAELDGNFTDLDARTATAWVMDGLEPTLREGFGNPAELADFIGNTVTYAFVAGSTSEVFVNWDVPFEFSGGNIYAAIHWSPGASTNTGTVRWGLEFTTAPVDGVFGATQTFYVEGNSLGTANSHIQTVSAPYTGAVANQRFFIRLFRDGAAAGDSFPDSAYLLGIDFYYQVNKLGKTSFTAVGEVLQKYGTDAHVWIPGVGYFSGYQAANYIDSAGTQTGLVDNPVGRANDAVGAITATQGTTANKPILRRGAVNLLTYSNDFSNVSWSKVNSATVTGTNVVNLAAVANSRIEKTQSSSVGMTWTASITVSGTGNCRLGIFDNGGGFPGTYTSIITLTNTPTRYSITRTHTDAAATSIGWRIINEASAAATVTAENAQLELGSTASEYIPTTTAAASSSSGNYYWQLDGSNDSLALSSVPFQMADDHAVIAGARQSAGGSNKFLFSPAGQPATTRTIASIYADTNGNWAVLWRDDAGSLGTAFASAGALPLGSVGVISGIKSGNNKKIRINGAQSGSTNTTVMGATTVSVGYIGADQNSAQGFLGSIFPVIAIKGTVSDTDLLILEKWVGQMSGVVI